VSGTVVEIGYKCPFSGVSKAILKVAVNVDSYLLLFATIYSFSLAH
jgi:hypothetical protein